MTAETTKTPRPKKSHRPIGVRLPRTIPLDRIERDFSTIKDAVDVMTDIQKVVVTVSDAALIQLTTSFMLPGALMAQAIMWVIHEQTRAITQPLARPDSEGPSFETKAAMKEGEDVSLWYRTKEELFDALEAPHRR